MNGRGHIIGITFGDLLGALMKDAGMNQTDLAKKTGLSQSAISNLINGNNSPQTKTVDLIVNGLFAPRKRNSAMAALLRKAAELPAPNPRFASRTPY